MHNQFHLSVTGEIVIWQFWKWKYTFTLTLRIWHEFDQDFDESESDDDLEQLTEGGGEEAQDGHKLGRHQVHFLPTFHCDPHEHYLDDHGLHEDDLDELQFTRSIHIV